MKRLTRKSRCCPWRIVCFCTHSLPTTLRYHRQLAVLEHSQTVWTFKRHGPDVKGGSTKRFLVIAISFVFVALATVSAQTPGKLREKYGPADEKGRYTVRPGIGLEATFDPEGKPTEMTVKLLDEGTTPGSIKPQCRNAMRKHARLFGKLKKTQRRLRFT